MKALLLIILIIHCLSSCNSKSEKIITGKLNPNIRSYINFQTATDSEIKNYIKRIDSLANKYRDPELKTSSKYYHNLLKYNLIRTHSIYIKQKDHSEINIFLHKNQYLKIKKYDYLGSNRIYEVNIKLKYKKIDDNIFLSDSIIEAKISSSKK
ncbi:hypothetical protein SAMN05192550_0998 [Flavobacterium glycines]|uniref:Uncharacterized protein n=1 Tax=Flavobacterium glycines TaxID=551990 RepID=A0A1B9DS23_9FLAO|nr:hypothetical protein [Flavobacterium glycines]OCB72490.1 hypothetical protein FBGL_07570 [Flavobacterium glycines]GEL09983.1 hypothetical protein FGL01_07220 [Flavobacterium glycines]SDI86096.1 hypothetical protein SAMN05192550_0998 [Flavobacterium glycines]